MTTNPLRAALEDARSTLAGMTPSYGHQLKEKIAGLDRIKAALAAPEIAPEQKPTCYVNKVNIERLGQHVFVDATIKAERVSQFDVALFATPQQAVPTPTMSQFASRADYDAAVTQQAAPEQAVTGSQLSWRNADISVACRFLSDESNFDGAAILREWEAMKEIAQQAAPATISSWLSEIDADGYRTDDERMAARILLKIAPVAQQAAPTATSDEFKNFHRNLCARFDYCHDEKDWKRDQVSLIEHIAKKANVAQQAAPEQATEPIAVVKAKKDGNGGLWVHWSGKPHAGMELFAAPLPQQREDSDAARFRWLTEDHADPQVRAKCRDIIVALPVMSYSAACMNIDSAIAKEGKTT